MPLLGLSDLQREVCCCHWDLDHWASVLAMPNSEADSFMIIGYVGRSCCQLCHHHSLCFCNHRTQPCCQWSQDEWRSLMVWVHALSPDLQVEDSPWSLGVLWPFIVKSAFLLASLNPPLQLASPLCCIVAAATFRLTLCCARVEFWHQMSLSFGSNN